MLKFYSSGSIKKVAIIILATIVIASLGSYFLNKQSKQEETIQKPLLREEILAIQRAELDRLREEAIANPLTEAELKKQRAELDKLRKEYQTNPLSQEELDRQREELDKLREHSDL